MPVVPTSQVSVIPTAPRVDIQSFVPKLDPTAGLGTFMAAAQLPLAMEQIDLQREKNKAERSQLDFLKKQTEYNIRNYDAIQEAARKKDELDADIKRQNLAKAKVDLAAAQAKVDLEKRATPLEYAQIYPAIPTDKKVDSSVDTGTSVSVAEATTPAQQPTPEEILRRDQEESNRRATYPASMNTVSPFVKPMSVEDAVALETRRLLDEKLGTGEFVSVKDTQDAAKYVRENLSTLEPKDDFYRFIDDNNVPLKVKVRRVGKLNIAQLGDPVIDVAKVYEEFPAVKEFDLKWSAEAGKESPSELAAQRQNVNRLMQAVETYADLQKTGGTIERSKFVGLLPKQLQALVAPEQVLSADMVRTAIQESLRRVLGAAFTQKEGTDMMDRSFNLLLPPGANVELVRMAVQTAETAIRDREDQLNYFKKNGTLFQFSPRGGLINANGSPNLDRLEQIANTLNPTGTAAPGGATPPPAGPTEQQVKAGADLLTKARANYNASLGSVAKAAAQKP